MRVYLIRHGETDWNHVSRFQGREDIPLNEAGITQAMRCGQTLQGLGITAVYTSPLMRARRTGEEIAKQTGIGREAVQTMQELIERDLGPFSGQYVKDKKEYFALASGDHVEGMEPFSDVQKRMELALRLLAGTGHESIVAVSHGAAINVLLAGLSNHEIGTGKTRLYNGSINVIEGTAERGFHVVHCNLPPDDPQTHHILSADVEGYGRLEKSLIDLMKEEQAKLGFRKEAVRLYYPLSTLQHFFDCQDGEKEMLQRLQELPRGLCSRLGTVTVTAKGELFCFFIPEEGSIYVKEHMKPNEFIRDLVETVGRHGCTMEEIKELFCSRSPEPGSVECKPVDNGEFDWLIRFVNDPEDSYYYCFKQEGMHMIYHRFLPEDYADFAF